MPFRRRKFSISSRPVPARSPRSSHGRRKRDKTGWPCGVAPLSRSLGELIAAYQAEERIDSEELENRLSVLEQKLSAALTQASSEELLGDLRREAGNSLASYRGRMNAMQVAALEQQLLKKRLFEHYRLPRLSLFYL